jgi:hypothetical protein
MVLGPKKSFVVKTISNQAEYSFFGYIKLLRISYQFLQLSHTVNQLLFAATLFRNFSTLNWFAASIFQDQAFFIQNS